MADSDIATQAISLRELHTNSVTITPRNAQIARVVEGLSLEPGSNLIQITGLSPTIDPGSVKVDGYGRASISSVTVERVRNAEHYRDVYDSDSEDEDDRPDPHRLPDKSSQQLELEREVRKMQADITLLEEEIRHAEAAQSHNTVLTKSVGAKEPMEAADIASRVEKFQLTSQRLAKQVQVAWEKKVPLAEEYPKLKAEMEAGQRAYMRETKEQRTEIKRAEAKWKRAKQARQKARQELLEERSKFWPKFVYKVSVLLEGPEEQDAAAKDPTVSLGLSYVTTDASWTPVYEVGIESESQSATLVYRAEISNETSETWRDARVTLNTSKTSFTGINDPIPELKPWNLRLSTPQALFGHSSLVSVQEQAAKANQAQSETKAVSRSANFGLPGNDNSSWSSEDEEDEAIPFALTGAAPPPPPPPPPAPAALFGASPYNSGFPPAPGALPHGAGASDQQARGNVQLDAALGSAVSRRRSALGSMRRGGAVFGGARAEEGGSIASTAVSQARESQFEQQEQMATAEGAWEETGLTASWELGGGSGGRHTIAPSSSRRRYRVSTMALEDLDLRHVCVPKLRAAAFLTARLRNPSEQTILAGDAGLTLDGTFLGTIALERIAPGAAVTVSLGVDESVAVDYAPPVERQNLTTGLIKQDASLSFRRYVTLRHTQAASPAAAKEGKGPAPITIAVRDQVPIALDERIRIDLTSPRGLRSVGDSARAGEAVYDETTAQRSPAQGSKASAAGRDAWGTAVAKLAKDGKVEWNVKLNPGHKVALPLEYEAKYPSGQRLVTN